MICLLLSILVLSTTGLIRFLAPLRPIEVVSDQVLSVSSIAIGCNRLLEQSAPYANESSRTYYHPPCDLFNMDRIYSLASSSLSCAQAPVCARFHPCRVEWQVSTYQATPHLSFPNTHQLELQACTQQGSNMTTRPFRCTYNSWVTRQSDHTMSHVVHFPHVNASEYTVFYKRLSPDCPCAEWHEPSLALLELGRCIQVTVRMGLSNGTETRRTSQACNVDLTCANLDLEGMMASRSIPGAMTTMDDKFWPWSTYIMIFGGGLMGVALLLVLVYVHIDNQLHLCVPEPYDCPICLQKLKDKPITRLPCQHSLHTQCITGWARNARTCPICRYPF
jgi:hypothetical protein